MKLAFSLLRGIKILFLIAHLLSSPVYGMLAGGRPNAISGGHNAFAGVVNPANAVWIKDRFDMGLFLVHQKVDSLLINFFKMLEEDYIEREKQIQELYFLCNLVNLKSRKKTIFSIHLIPIFKNLGFHSFFVRLFVKSDFLLFESLKPRLLCPEYKIKANFNPSFKKKFVQVNHALIKTLIKSISQPLTKSVNQKLFNDYKNLTLNYSQTLKFVEFD